ncbi:hypothetical protein L6R53_10525 [Myxococcota bacterium]|nr:hypothetical protein [Myxococcota bacterium]
MSTEALWDALTAFIGGGPGEFVDLALRLHAWQRAHNPQYDAICGDQPAPARWQDIPTVPVGLFRDLPLTCFPPDQAAVVFRTSGTTVGRRGEHRCRDTALYDLGARRNAAHHLGPLPRAGVALVPYAPDSSLGHMCRDLVPGMPTFFSSEHGVDAAGAWAALRAATEPLFVPGTAFAFDLLVSTATGPVQLPAGSVVMVTGGSKGRAVVLSEPDLDLALRQLLPGARIVGEYGMTELSSQLWAVPWGAPYQPPPWLRVKAVEPATGELLPPGQEGLLSFVDLANRWTVLAIETQDLGVVGEDGAVTLRGRVAGAPARGCSLSVEEALARAAPAGVGGRPA